MRTPANTNLEVPKLITATEAAAILGVQVGTIYDHICRGELRVVRLGKNHSPIRLHLADFLQWIEARTVEPVA